LAEEINKDEDKYDVRIDEIIGVDCMPIKVEESVDTNDVINDVIIVSCTVDVG
jgi:hypothetical protein